MHWKDCYDYRKHFAKLGEGKKLILVGAAFLFHKGNNGSILWRQYILMAHSILLAL